MLRNSTKLAQRRLYDFLNTWSGCCVIILGIFWILHAAIYAIPKPLRGGSVHCSHTDFNDNIGNLYLEQYLAYEPMDVVYTWVNGSDPKWQRRKQLAQARLTTNMTNTTDDTISINRFRDREELRYSLRSLEKYAPWIRRVFLVTDNQIPYWLNMHSSRISVITHDQIFPNKSHLPVFSSPAIESHLHRIPGLSKRFIYFNDDVFLGAPVHPEDFVSVSGLQKLYLSWDVPKCAPGCVESWIGDGYCDKACNVSECNFDFPDCVNGTNALTKGASRAAAAAAKSSFCSSGCPENWLADKVCDNRCKNKECGWDMGDCGVQLLVEDFPGVVLNDTNAIISAYPTDGNSTAYPSFCDLPVLTTVEKGTNLVYIRLNSMFCASKPGSLCNDKSVIANFTYSKADYTPFVVREDYCPVVENDVIQTASLLSKHNMLALLLQTNSMPIESLPARVALHITGHNAATGMNVTAAFAVEVVAPSDEFISGVPEDMGRITGYAGSCGISSDEHPVLPLASVRVLEDPFRMAHVGEEGIALSFAFEPIDLDVANIPLSAISATTSLTLPNGTSFTTTTPFCDMIGSIHFATHLIGRAYYDTKLCGRRMLGQIMYPSGRLSITLEPKDVVTMIRMPWKWSELPSTWIHGRLIIEIDVAAQKKANVTHPVSGIAVCAAMSFRYGGYVPEHIPVLSENNTTLSNTSTLASDLQNGYRGRRLESIVSNEHPSLGSILSSVYLTSVQVISKYWQSLFITRPHGRRLLDTYGASLRHVNRLYSKEFGTEHRKVPAHMPHMINRDYIEEMQGKWSEEWEATSSNAFRSPTDMQYSFSYYYYLMNRNKAIPPDVKKYLANEVDTDFDGFINDNEFLTLASLVYGTSPTESQIQELRENCTSNRTVTMTKHQRTSYADAVLDETVTIQALPTLQDVSNCSLAVDGLLKNVQWPAFHSLGTEKDIAFEMIGDNYTIAIAQLNSIRARKTKFVCVNDNMQEINPQLDKALAEFYTSFFPYPSQFELPAGERNPTLYVDEYRSNYAYAAPSDTWRSMRLLMRHVGDGITQGIIWMSQWFVEKLEPEASRSIAQSYRHARMSQQGIMLSYHVLFFSSVGLVGVILLRMSVRRRRNLNQSASPPVSTPLPSESPSKIPRKGKVEGWFGKANVDEIIDEGQYETADYLGPRLPSPSPPQPSTARVPTRRNSGGNIDKKSSGDEDFLNTLWRSAGFGKNESTPQRSKSTDDMDDDNVSVSTLGMGGIEDYTPSISYGLDDIAVNRRPTSAEPLASAMRRSGTTSGVKKSVHWSSNEYGMGSSNHPSSGEDSSSSYSVGGMAKYLSKGIKGKVESIKRGFSLSGSSKSDEF